MPHFIIGDRVSVAGYSCKGKVRWIGEVVGQGPTPAVPTRHLGIELDDPIGDNDGTTEQGRSCFKAKPMHGIFVLPMKVALVIVRVRMKPIPDMPGITVGSRCTVHRLKCSGTIRWTGKVPTEGRYSVGVELDKQIGANSGIVKERFSLFECPMNFGIMVEPEGLTVAPASVKRRRSMSMMQSARIQKTFNIGDWVTVEGFSCPGQIKWIGNLKSDVEPIPRCGIQLTDPIGKNSGTVKGEFLFECPENHGLCVNMSLLRRAHAPGSGPSLRRRSSIDNASPTSPFPGSNNSSRVRSATIGSRPSSLSSPHSGLDGFGSEEKEISEELYINDISPRQRTLSVGSDSVYTNVSVLTETDSPPLSEDVDEETYQNMAHTLKDVTIGTTESQDVEVYQNVSNVYDPSHNQSSPPSGGDMYTETVDDSDSPVVSTSGEIVYKTSGAASQDDRYATAPFSASSAKPIVGYSVPIKSRPAQKATPLWNCLGQPREEAHRRLMAGSPGWFVIRESTTTFAALSMKDDDNKIFNKRIVESVGDVCFENSKKWFLSIEELVEHYTGPTNDGVIPRRLDPAAGGDPTNGISNNESVGSNRREMLPNSYMNAAPNELVAADAGDNPNSYMNVNPDSTNVVDKNDPSGEKRREHLPNSYMNAGSNEFVAADLGDNPISSMNVNPAVVHDGDLLSSNDEASHSENSRKPSGSYVNLDTEEIATLVNANQQGSEFASQDKSSKTSNSYVNVDPELAVNMQESESADDQLASTSPIKNHVSFGTGDNIDDFGFDDDGFDDDENDIGF